MKSPFKFIMRSFSNIAKHVGWLLMRWLTVQQRAYLEKPGYENHGHERNIHWSRSPPRERHYDGGFMKDARVSHYRSDEYNDRFPGEHGRYDRKIYSASTRQISRYAPYEKKKQQSWMIKDNKGTREDVNVKSIAPYVHIPHAGDIGG
ncbi:hypothetical protein F2Q68_00034395 [Brassica cretica]|uniref:Uncharacterized protein n=2 Tax=Brassica cretica TaxID=69181 RepID=A0A8S9GY19_BRACR|nr:hypothetical protein F2Q68_00034395 [Brassica cretica]KAF3596256.1 hypothetical protein DY000_02022203 [Brassica cretica]